MTLGIGKHNKNVRNVVKRRVSCCKLPGPSKTAIQIMLESDNFTTTILNQFNIDTNNTEVISNASLDDNITVDVTLKIDNITLADISTEDQTKLIDDTKNYIANTLGYNINNILVYLSEGSVNINIVVFAEVEDSVFTDVDDNEYRISVLGEITESTYNDVTQNGNTLTKDNIKTAVLGNNVTSIGASAFINCTSLTSITIPNSVTSINNFAFQLCTSLTSIIIPNSVTSIGDWAFRSCNSLTEITIPSSVNTIGIRAFWSCNNVTEFTIPDSVTTIGDSAFAYCYNVKQFIVSSNSNHFEAIDGVLYKKNSDNTLELIQYPLAKGNTAFTFPNNVVKLLSRCFAAEKNLKSLVIPDSITSLDGDWTFYDMNIVSIQLSNNLENIGGIGTFYSCNSLESITIPNSVRSIASYSFRSCTSLISVTFEENSQIETIADFAFANSALITILIYENSITISGNTYNVGDNNISFFGANDNNIIDINTPPNAIITDIDDNEFKLYGELNDTNVRKVVQFQAERIKTVFIGSIATSINVWTFYNCQNLISVTFEDNSQIKTIDSAFSECTSLTSVIFGENSQLETIEGSAFRSTALTSTTIPNSVTSINNSAFRNILTLTTVTFEENSQIETIEDFAFAGSGLTTVNIYGSSITISGNTYNAGDNINFFGVNGVSIVQISS